MTFATSALALLSAASGEIALPADPAPALFAGLEQMPASGRMDECAGLFREWLEPQEASTEPGSAEAGNSDPLAAAEAFARICWAVPAGLFTMSAQVEQAKPLEELVELVKLQEPAARLIWVTKDQGGDRPVVPLNPAAADVPDAHSARSVVSDNSPQTLTTAFTLFLKPEAKPVPEARPVELAVADSAVPHVRFSSTASSCAEAPSLLIDPNHPVLAELPEDCRSRQQDSPQHPVPAKSCEKHPADPPPLQSQAECEGSTKCIDPLGESVPHGVEDTDATPAPPGGRDAEPSPEDGQDSQPRKEAHPPFLSHAKHEPNNDPVWHGAVERTVETPRVDSRPGPTTETRRPLPSAAQESTGDKPPQPVRELVVQLPAREGRGVEIRFVDRRNGVEVTARTQRQQDAVPLQANLENLRERLVGRGFTSELMPASCGSEGDFRLPVHDAPWPAARETVTAASAAGQATPGGAEGHGHGDHHRRSLAMWLNQVEDSLDGEAEAKQKERK